MKITKIITSFAIAILFSFSIQAQVKWIPIEEAGATQVKENTKLFFVDFSTSWCGWCKKMDKQTFSNSAVYTIMNHYFIPVHFNAESKDNFSWNGTEFKGTRRGTHDFTKAILGNQIGYPSVAIFNEKMQLIQVQPGFLPPDEMIKFLCFFINDNYKKYSYEKFIAEFDNVIYPQIKKELGL